MKQKRLFLLDKDQDDILAELLVIERFSMVIDLSKITHSKEPDYVISKNVFSKNIKSYGRNISVRPDDVDGKRNIIDIVYHIDRNSIKDTVFLV